MREKYINPTAQVYYLTPYRALCNSIVHGNALIDYDILDESDIEWDEY